MSLDDCGDNEFLMLGLLRKKEARGKEERKIRSSILILDLKMASCKIQEGKKKAWMIMCVELTRQKHIKRKARRSIIIASHSPKVYLQMLSSRHTNSS